MVYDRFVTLGIQHCQEQLQSAEIKIYQAIDTVRRFSYDVYQPTFPEAMDKLIKEVVEAGFITVYSLFELEADEDSGDVSVDSIDYIMNVVSFLCFLKNFVLQNDMKYVIHS